MTSLQKCIKRSIHKKGQFDIRDKKNSGSISIGEYLYTFFNNTSNHDNETLRSKLDAQMNNFKTIDKDLDGTLTFFPKF